MFRLKDLMARDYFVVGAHIQTTSEGTVVKIPDNPWVGISKEDRKDVFENPNSRYAKDGLRRWVCAGTLNIYLHNGKRYIGLAKKDSKAPAYPNQLSITGGLSNSLEECYYPILTAIREGIEETAIYLPEENLLVVPDIPTEKRFNRYKDTIYTDVHKHVLTPHVRKLFPQFKNKKSSYNIDQVQACLVNTSHDSLLWVEHLQETYGPYAGIIQHEPQRNGLNFYKIVEIQLPDSPFILVDCEKLPDGKYLNLPIYLFDLGKLKAKRMLLDPKHKSNNHQERFWINGSECFFKSGEKHSADPKEYFPCNPVAGDILEIALKHYKYL